MRTDLFGDDGDSPCNPSTAPRFQTIVDQSCSRRGFLKMGLGMSAAIFLGGPAALKTARASTATASPLLGFKSIPTSIDDALHLPPGYSAQIFAPWGTPLLDNAPPWKRDATDDAAAQATQVGDNHDGMHFFALKGRHDEGLLVINHEYSTLTKVDYQWLFGRGGTLPWTADKALKAMNAHGVSVMHIKRLAEGQWEIVQESSYNRRITASTPMALTGPAAGNSLLKTSADPSGTQVLGTFNNCGNGWTPWGTYLACEENFNFYFGSTPPTSAATIAQQRYGLPTHRSYFRWDDFNPRFNYAKEPNEPNRFGWIVEIDPFNPASVPKKRTALGRFAHENAAHTFTKDGRIVIYMGDDHRDDYLYKFVSRDRYIAGGDNSQLLDHGQLYVARFNADNPSKDFAGGGEWLLLDKSRNPILAAHPGFADQAEVLIYTRLAADAVGATPMDRPEWVSVHPQTGEVYVTLTNNNKRQTAGPANPRADNIYGQIVRWREAGGDADATAFEWDLFVLAGNPVKHTDRKDLRSGSGNITPENMFNSPDGLAFDAFGRLWIQTDGKYSNSGDYEGQGNNQMLCADPASGEIRRFLVGPKECEITGLTFTPDHRTLFVNVQHPGETGNSNWPDGGNAIPRSATVIITKDDGGIIGT